MGTPRRSLVTIDVLRSAQLQMIRIGQRERNAALSTKSSGSIYDKEIGHVYLIYGKVSLVILIVCDVKRLRDIFRWVCVTKVTLCNFSLYFEMKMWANAIILK